MPAAGEVVAEFVDQQNAEQGDGEGPAGLEELRDGRQSQPQGQRSLSRTTGGMPSRKFCMNRAPLAVVVTTLAASSSSGRPYSRKIERTGLLVAVKQEGCRHPASAGESEGLRPESPIRRAQPRSAVKSADEVARTPEP